MSKRNLTLLSCLIGLVLFFAINIFASAALRSMRFDLTEEKLYTLSEGSLSIAENIEEPIRLYFYFAKDAASEYPQIQTHGTFVREILDEYVRASDGMIELEVIDPEPFSEEEDRARGEGISGRPTRGGQVLYFGLVGTNSTDDREVIEFFDPTAERFLEYELARLIHTLANPERAVVGILAGLPIEGTPPNPMMGGGQPGWKIVEYVGQMYETRVLDSGLEEIPEDVDLLVLLHPRDLSQLTLYAIDQFVLGGGKAVVYVDPHCEMDQSGADPSNPMASMQASKASDLEPLFEAWGIQLVDNKIAADRKNALVQETLEDNRVVERSLVHVLDLDASGMDEEDAVTSALNRMILLSPGILEALPGATTEFHPLVQTSEESMRMDVQSVKFMPDPARLLNQFIPSNERLTIAARISGEVQSAFPGGKPGGEDEAADAEDEAGDGSEESEPSEEETGRLAASVGPINVVVVADADNLADMLWVREQRLGNLSLGWLRTSDNGDFLLNALENLHGGTDLISIRARGKLARPFDKVEEIRQDAEQRYLSQKQALENELRDTQARINELQREKSPDTALILSPEQESELRRFRERELETKKKLRDVQHSMIKDIERLGTRIKWINMGLIPALVAIVACLLGWWRVQRRTS